MVYLPSVPCFLYKYSYLCLCGRVLKVVKSAPYTVMEVEVGILDHKPVEGEPSMWGADEGTQLDDLEDQVRTATGQILPTE